MTPGISARIHVQRPAGSRRGQSLVELAIVLPILLIILLLAADIGRALSAYIQLGNMAREGAAYAARNPTDGNGIRQAALGEGGAIFGVTPTVQTAAPQGDGFRVPNTNNQQYQRIRVTVTYQFEPIVAFPPIPDQITMRRQAEMRVIGGT